MRPWARRVLRSSSSSHHSSTLRGSALGTGIWTRCWTTRTGPWPGAWLACHALFRHVAEHHFGTRPRDGAGALFPHQPHSTDWSGRRWDATEPWTFSASSKLQTPRVDHSGRRGATPTRVLQEEILVRLNSRRLVCFAATKDLVDYVRDGRGGVDHDTVLRNVLSRLMQSRNELPFRLPSAPFIFRSLVKPPVQGVEVDLEDENAVKQLDEV